MSPTRLIQTQKVKQSFFRKSNQLKENIRSENREIDKYYIYLLVVFPLYSGSIQF